MRGLTLFLKKKMTGRKLFHRKSDEAQTFYVRDRPKFMGYQGRVKNRRAKSFFDS